MTTTTDVMNLAMKALNRLGDRGVMAAVEFRLSDDDDFMLVLVKGNDGIGWVKSVLALNPHNPDSASIPEEYRPNGAFPSPHPDPVPWYRRWF